MPILLSLGLAITIVLIVAMLLDRALLERAGTILWFVAGMLVLIGLYYLVAGPRYFVVASALGFCMIGFGLIRVPEDPPHVGVLTWWSKRLPVLLPEGVHLLAPYFPLMLGVNPVNVEGENFSFTFENVHCKRVDKDGKDVPGGQVRVTVAGMFEPDYTSGAQRLITYLNRGGNEKVKNALETILQGATRSVASLLRWEDFTLMKAPLAAALLMKLTGARMPMLPRTGDVIEDTYLDISPDDYEGLGTEEVTDPLSHLAEAKGDETEYRNRYKDVEVFLKIALKGGLADIVDLGIQFKLFAIKEIEPEGALDEAAQAAAVEEAERRKEDLDFDTELHLAAKYLKQADSRDEKMTLEQALERVRINRGRAREFIVRSSGNQFADAAAMLGAGKQ